VRLGFLASHRGSGVQAVVDACASGRLAATPAVVISNNAGAEVLLRAERAGLPRYHLSRATHPEPDALDAAILDALRRHQADLVLLLGYLRKLGPRTLAHYAGRVLNVHPALLPRFGGAGMYGDRVHAAVLEAGDKETGVTVHVVDGEYDAGPIVAQCTVEVRPDDTVATLGERVGAREHALVVETLRRIVADGVVAR
jgi:phosphoribosylglycinamide formyltransferase-1